MITEGKTIFCDECKMEIKDRDSLVISSFLFYFGTYHDKCYSKSLKGCQTLFVGNEPINGFSGNVKAIAAFVVAIILFFINGPFFLLGLVILIVPLIRLYAWISIERHLE
ncbi:hypothetical protein [Pseudalkalibacillus sp. SCS-8]|uniref:hypothetical protein n=1 Tax=Pseudalkalibacillus nanhaiensis TaxID=3115291 RepID=UPI0032DA3733